MSKRAETRRLARDVFGYRGKKAKRRRKVDPRVIQAFFAVLQAPEPEE